MKNFESNSEHQNIQQIIFHDNYPDYITYAIFSAISDNSLFILNL